MSFSITSKLLHFFHEFEFFYHEIGEKREKEIGEREKDGEKDGVIEGEGEREERERRTSLRGP